MGGFAKGTIFTPALHKWRESLLPGRLRCEKSVLLQVRQLRYRERHERRMIAAKKHGIARDDGLCRRGRVWLEHAGVGIRVEVRSRRRAYGHTDPVALQQTFVLR